MKKFKRVIVWIRNDLRLVDNPALNYAAKVSREVVCLYMYEGNEEGDLSVGGASKWWLHSALCDFAKQLESRGGKLVLECGANPEKLVEYIRSFKVEAVFWNRRYEPTGIQKDTEMKVYLKSEGIEAKSFS